MRTFTKLMAGAAFAVTATALAVAPAMADPINGKGKPVTPAATDVVGVGSDTIQNVLNQFSVSYNASHKTGPRLYSWDATNPSTGAIGDMITLKKGCKALARPNGSSGGIAALTTENATTGKSPCMDFARSSRDRATTDPAFTAGGISFIALGGDAVTYATFPGSNAPANLSTKQLFQIYTCGVPAKGGNPANNWADLGGKKGPIKAFIPQSGSGTRSFFLTAIGITSGVPGTCVSDGATKKVPGGTVEENEGVNALLNKDKPDTIFPFSIGKYIAERYHSAKCLSHFCKPETSGSNKGKTCLPSKTQNQFGCDTHGSMVLNKVNNTAPTKPFPLPSKGSPTVNPGFSKLFTRSLFIVVSFPKKSQTNGIPNYLLPFFGPKGFTCSAAAKPILLNYGFVVFPKGTSNGHATNKCGDTH
jgi:ABC-type phosphate transport system substrate-binding protein